VFAFLFDFTNAGEMSTAQFCNSFAHIGKFMQIFIY